MSAETGLALTQDDIDALLNAMPYALKLGMRARLMGDELTLVLPFKPALIGNPMIPALHGGAIGAFMEIAAQTQLAVALRQTRLPKTVDVTIDFLRSGRPADAYARAYLTKLGRRIANVRVHAWQAVKEEPIAILHGHFMARSEDAA